ncbi:RNA polymerase sigma factor [Desulfofalx alkaliphila]|uniref:RNA polymerase sigma factor n=1 Tax=Desulfofalx alkaliphila TaxID=105483 RepID=UPI0004E2663A|nr:sigma-70 family RNA polymerase sigma factor [Desulfofalx alkaliphila]
MIRTNKKMKRVGCFPTRTPRKDDFSEYVYCFADGSKSVIARSELSPEIDAVMYEMLRAEGNNNEVQIEKHRAYAKGQEKQDALLHMQPSSGDFEENVILGVELREAMKLLQARQRELIYKKFIEGKSNTQIAREEGVTEGAIRARLRKIRNKLRLFKGSMN